MSLLEAGGISIWQSKRSNQIRYEIWIRKRPRHIRNILKRHKLIRTEVTKFGELESRWWVVTDVAQLRKWNFSLAWVKTKKQPGLHTRIPKRPKNLQHKALLEIYKTRKNDCKSIWEVDGAPDLLLKPLWWGNCFPNPLRTLMFSLWRGSLGWLEV